MPTGRIGVRSTGFSLAVGDPSTTVRLVEGATALVVVTGAVVALLVLLAGWIGLRRRRRARVAP